MTTTAPDQKASKAAWAILAAMGFGALLIGLSVFQAEFDFGIAQFRMVFAPLMIAAAAALTLVAARLYGGLMKVPQPTPYALNPTETALATLIVRIEPGRARRLVAHIRDVIRPAYLLWTFHCSILRSGSLGSKMSTRY